MDSHHFQIYRQTIPRELVNVIPPYDFLHVPIFDFLNNLIIWFIGQWKMR
jgi:hypothetical protein